MLQGDSRPPALIGRGAEVAVPEASPVQATREPAQFIIADNATAQPWVAATELLARVPREHPRLLFPKTTLAEVRATLDLTEASVVTLYLLPELNVRLRPRLKKLKPGSRIVSHDFDMRGAKPVDVQKVKSKDSESQEDVEHTVFKWVVPWEKDPTVPPDPPSPER